MAHHRFELADGRAIGVSSAGDPASPRLVVLCLPTPGAGMFDPDPLVTAASGVHLISVDRPGNGSSDPLPLGAARSIERCADDIGEYVTYSEDLARHISRTEFGTIGVIGWGTGGCIALSLAARFPDLVDHVVTVATPAPRTLRRTLRSRRRGLYREYPMSMVASLAASAQDAALEKAGARNRLERMVSDAYTQDTAGVEFDLACLDDRGWTRGLNEVRAQITLAYGDDDESAPSAGGRWYQRRMRKARVLSLPGSGPLAIVTRWQALLELQNPAGTLSSPPSR